MTAVKLRIKDLVEGTCDGRSVSTIFGEVSEARVLGTLIDIFVSDDENYMSLTVDDGTETVRIKAWRQDVGKLKKFSKGDLIDVVGKVREYNEEIYLTPEVVLKVSPNKWVLRELELMKLYVRSGALEKVSEREPLEKEIESELEEEPEIESTGVGERERKKETKKEVERQIEREEKTEPQKESEKELEEITRKEEHPKEEKEEKVEEIEKEEKAEHIEEEEKVEKEEDKDTFEEEYELGEIEEFEVLGEDEVVETVLELLQEEMTKEILIEKSGLDEIDVELALRELMDEGKVKKEGNTYKKAG